MGNTAGEIKAYVFIAQSDGEYKKYRFSEADDESDIEGSVCRWRFSPDQKLLRIVINKWNEKGKNKENWLSPKGWEYLNPTDGTLNSGIVKYYKEKDDFEKDTMELELKEMVGEIFGSGKGGLSEKIHELVQQVLTRLDSNVGVPILSRNMQLSCCVFLHWGGGDDEAYRRREEFVRKNWPEECEGWRIYSIGTRRNNVFSVDEDLIIVPYEESVLQELEYKIKINYARELESVKNAMTRFIRSRTSNDEDKVRLEEFFSTDTFREKLRSVAKEAKFAWLLDWNLFRCLMSVRDNDHDQVKRIIVEMMEPKEYDLHTKSFFSQLLSEGILG